MLKQVRQEIIHDLWEKYRTATPQMQLIESQLKQHGVANLVLDHFAIIDLPGPHTGIPYLSELFSLLGYVYQGKDYLADKQNDFLWLAEHDSRLSHAKNVLPQVVVADFRLSEMPAPVQTIIEKYAHQAEVAPIALVKNLLERMQTSAAAGVELKQVITSYLSGRDWPLPTLHDYQVVQEFNELLAWVLVFGRRVNHFTLSIHLLDHFVDFNDFLAFIENETSLSLNREGGVMKGDPHTGIAQGSTSGMPEKVQLADGEIEIPMGFVEFVWRYPQKAKAAVLWQDYFTGFVAQHADRVIESLFVID